MTRQERQRRLLTLLQQEPLVHRARIEAVLYSYHNWDTHRNISAFLDSVIGAGLVQLDTSKGYVLYRLTDAGREAVMEMTNE